MIRDSKGRFIKGNPSGNMKGKKSWNSGLKGEDFLSHYKNGHPRGMKGKKAYNKGISMSKEKKEHLSFINTGRKHTNEHKEKIRLGMLGKQNTLGKTQTQETRQKISKSNKGNKKIIERRSTQIFPKKDTKIEIKIQNFLKELNLEFYTHVYMKEIEHAYQCDFFIPVQEGINKKIILECFGNYWHNYPTARPIDTTRCIELRKKGYTVIVFWESEIKEMKLDDLKNKLLLIQ